MDRVILRVASSPSRRGIRMSIRTTSGTSRGQGNRFGPVGGFPDDGDGVLGVQELAETGPEKFLVVGDEHPDGHGTANSPARTGSRA